MESLGRALLRPELQPQLVGHHRLLAGPSGLAEGLSEDALGIARGHRCRSCLVVVASVVEKRDPRLTSGPHHRLSLVPGDSLERSPRSERQTADVDPRMTETRAIHRDSPWSCFDLDV